MKIQNILILAGGDSTRFWPLKNKILYRFLGKPLIQHIYEAAVKYSEKITIVASDSLVTSLRSLLPHAQVIAQTVSLEGQAGAILTAKDKIVGDVLILNANDIFNFEILFQLINKLKQNKLDGLILAKKVKNYFPGGYLILKEDKLAGIVEKPSPEEVPSDIVKMFADYYSNFETLVGTLEKVQSKNDDQYEKGLNSLIGNGNKVDFLTYDDYWYTLKYPWHILPMMTHYLNTLNKEIKLGKNVRIAKTAKIEGPCFIDDNTVIGDFALIRQSHIGKNCLVGGYSEITRSYLGNNVSLHRNYVGDSVLDEHVLFGAEATTANFRFDENTVKSSIGDIRTDSQMTKLGTIVGKGSKIGVNTTLLPGIKVGSHTYIAPGCTIVEDVEDNMFVKRKKVINTHIKL